MKAWKLKTHLPKYKTKWLFNQSPVHAKYNGNCEPITKTETVVLSSILDLSGRRRLVLTDNIQVGHREWSRAHIFVRRGHPYFVQIILWPNCILESATCQRGCERPIGFLVQAKSSNIQSTDKCSDFEVTHKTNIYWHNGRSYTIEYY